MGNSQLTSFAARAEQVRHSQLTKFGARTVGAAGRSQLTKFGAHAPLGTGRSQLTKFGARNADTSTPTAVLTGPAVVGPLEEFVISLSNSFGAPFTAYTLIQLSGPPARSFIVSGDHATVIADAVKPNPVGFPSGQPVPPLTVGDVPIVMVFQGTVEKNSGAQVDADTLSVVLLAHSFHDAVGPVQIVFA